MQISLKMSEVRKNDEMCISEEKMAKLIIRVKYDIMKYNADKIRNGELDELVYSKDDIENSLVECGAAAESGKCS